MKVVISLTIIPPRLKYIDYFLYLLVKQSCDEIWLNIPKKYNRFPDWDGTLPDFSNFGSKLKINRDCEDLGPGTKVFGSAQFLDPEDLIVYLDDDTQYIAPVVQTLVKCFKTDEKSAWGLSGFTFENYFKNKYPRQHEGQVDVLEGYGAVIVKAGWIQKMTEEFKELREEARAADDVILSNLLTKQGVSLKTVLIPECNITQISQYTYGFESDALHHQFQGGHHENYLNVLKSLEVKGKSYFNYRT